MCIRDRRKDNSQKAFGPHFGQQNLSLLSQYLTPNRDAWPIAVDGIVMDRQKVTSTQYNPVQVIDIIDRKVVSIDNIGCGQVHLRIKIDRKNMCPSFRAVSYTHLDVYKRQVYTAVQGLSICV